MLKKESFYMKRILVIVILAVFLFLSCATKDQSLDQDQTQTQTQTHNQAHNKPQPQAPNPNNNTHWIVGSWTQEGGTVWVFNENGTGTAGKEKFTYGIYDGIEIYLSNGWGARKIFLSPDGKKMIIMGIVFQRI
jgi:hypothetical protein